VCSCFVAAVLSDGEYPQYLSSRMNYYFGGDAIQILGLMQGLSCAGHPYRMLLILHASEGCLALGQAPSFCAEQANLQYQKSLCGADWSLQSYHLGAVLNQYSQEVDSLGAVVMKKSGLRDVYASLEQAPHAYVDLLAENADAGMKNVAWERMPGALGKNS